MQAQEVAGRISGTVVGEIYAKSSQDLSLMTHKYMGSIVAFLISKSVEPNEEQKEMTSGFQQGNVCKCWNCK